MQPLQNLAALCPASLDLVMQVDRQGTGHLLQGLSGWPAYGIVDRAACWLLTVWLLIVFGVVDSQIFATQQLHSPPKYEGEEHLRCHGNKGVGWGS